jgi:Rv0078B-related antitoxin
MSHAIGIKPDVVDEQMAIVLRAKSPAQRLAIAHGMWGSTVRTIRAVLRSDHPDWSDEQIRRETARRLSHGAG